MLLISALMLKLGVYVGPTCRYLNIFKKRLTHILIIAVRAAVRAIDCQLSSFHSSRPYFCASLLTFAYTPIPLHLSQFFSMPPSAFKLQCPETAQLSLCLQISIPFIFTSYFIRLLIRLLFQIPAILFLWSSFIIKRPSPNLAVCCAVLIWISIQPILLPLYLPLASFLTVIPIHCLSHLFFAPSLVPSSAHPLLLFRHGSLSRINSPHYRRSAHTVIQPRLRHPRLLFERSKNGSTRQPLVISREGSFRSCAAQIRPVCLARHNPRRWHTIRKASQSLRSALPSSQEACSTCRNGSVSRICKRSTTTTSSVW